MKRTEAYKALLRHRYLSEKRACSNSQGNASRVMLLAVEALLCAYLVRLAFVLADFAGKSDSFSPAELLCGIMPFVLVLDITIRLSLQHTPFLMMHQYLLLPIPSMACVEVFVVSSLFSIRNAVWLALFLPYCIMTVLPCCGFLPTISILLTCQLAMLANSQWYAAIRSLIIRNTASCTLPVLAYAAAFSPLYAGNGAGVEQLFQLYSLPAKMFACSSLMPVIAAIIIVAVFTIANIYVQYSCVRDDIINTKPPRHIAVSPKWLNQDSSLSQYLKTEFYMLLRNKNTRRKFITATLTTVAIIIVVATTHLYDSASMSQFWCIYCYTAFSSLQLVNIMCYEGNFIESIAMREAGLLKWLQAKYTFHCATATVPFMTMLPLVFAGKWPLLMLIAFYSFTVGCQYFMLFQMAAYNTQTYPLNKRFTNRNGIGRNGAQIISGILSFAVPLTIINVLNTFASPTTTTIIMLAIGLLFAVTHTLWLGNIHTRIVRRRHEILEGLVDSRWA